MMCLKWFGGSSGALFKVALRVTECFVESGLEGHQVLCLKWFGESSDDVKRIRARSTRPTISRDPPSSARRRRVKRLGRTGQTHRQTQGLTHSTLKI